MKKPLIGITVGDPNGIGPEVALKCLLPASGLHEFCTPVLFGPIEVFRTAARRSRRRIEVRFHPLEEALAPGRASYHPPRNGIHAFIAPLPHPRGFTPIPGAVSARAGRIAADAIRAAVQAARAGVISAVVTAPVSKHALHRAGIRFPGQTEFLQHLTGSPRVAMILAAGKFRVGLATIHVPLHRVSRLLTRAHLTSRIETIHEALVLDWGIGRPSVAVLGLNPHAGEAGDLGGEEQRVIEPVLRALRRGGMDLHGPFPADAFFGRGLHRRYSAVVAMYHDQGLIPLKMAAQGNAVNVSAGLPIIRTSPDHGTGFDIAGTWRADPSSMIGAVRLAARIARARAAALRRKT